VLRRHATVIVADDERNLRDSLTELLTAEGYSVLQASDGREALTLAVSNPASTDAMLLDLRMPGGDGLEALQAMRADSRTREIPIIVITAFGGSEKTIAAMKAGAYDYITKPFDADHVLRTTARAVTSRKASATGSEAAPEPPIEETAGLIGSDPAMREIFKLIGRVAPTDAPVLITGESGTGKEVVARAIHEHSRRAHRPLVVVNCAAIPDALLESELFGYERGAFTGAVQAKPGRLEAADEGTLFLDEIGELALTLQAKLLRVLQDGWFERLGGNRPIRVDLRIVAATNQNLKSLIERGGFREDLFYRLNVVQIDVPPLRDRRTDIPTLANQFLKRVELDHTRRAPELSPEALRLLVNHDFPGNVRELENVIRRAAVLVSGPVIDAEDLTRILEAGKVSAQSSLAADLLEMRFGDARRTLEKTLIERALRQSAGNKAQAARILGIRRQQLYLLMKSLGIS
jgi:two-component system, NtrC family, response regulator AtoC